MHKLSVVLLLTALCSTKSYAVANGADLIKELLDAGRFNEAYALAMTYLNGSEGDPEFDFQYGVAAIDSGNVSEGMFALERVAFTDPDNPLVRLELARGYYLLNQFDKSKQLFEQVLQLTPPESVQRRIAKYLQLIEQNSFPITKAADTTVAGFVEIWRGFDSNINSAPESQTDLVTLSEDALGQGDQFNRIHLNGSIDHQYQTDRILDVSLSGNFRYYDTESEQNYSSVAINGGHTWADQQERYRLGGVVQKHMRDGKGYRSLLGINASWTYTPNNDSQLRLSTGVSSLDYIDSRSKDSTQFHLQGSYFQVGEGDWQPLWFAGLFVGEEVPETRGEVADAVVERFFSGSNIGVQLQPRFDLTLTPVITYQASRYKGEDGLYSVKRQDEFAMLNINIEWEFEHSWDLLFNIRSIHANSNIELYEYDRRQAMLGLRYSFK